MKKCLAHIIPVLLLITLAGCTGQMSATHKLDWYIGQGGKLDDCGPASAAMAVNWAGGKSSIRHAKLVTRNSGWWFFKDIIRHLRKQGIATYRTGLQNLPTLLKNGDGAIVRISVLSIPHYVFISELDDQARVLVADPLHGKKRINIRWLQKMIQDEMVLAVRNTPEHPVNKFKIKDIPWLKSGRATGRMPVIDIPGPQQGMPSHIW